MASSAATPAAPAEIAAAPTPVAPTPAPEDQTSRNSAWPLLLLGAILLAGLVALLLRGRRRRVEEYDYEPAASDEVVAPGVISSPAIADTVTAEAIAPAVRAERGRPEIALEMRPVRAGVNAEDAVVEFELTVDNKGSAAARDVRISTWMFPAGHGSEAERVLIEGAPEAQLSADRIDSGEARTIETAVALPTTGLDDDAMLPVVVAEAHYRLPDGSEAHASASFEVGVPVDGDLAHFDLDNPSGMHDDVVARPYKESAEP